MANVFIQYQDRAGWRTMVTMPSTCSSAQILKEMQYLENLYKGSRVRAVDDDGHVIDRL